MQIKVQFCWNGHRTLFRLMVCGGLRVYGEYWNRKTAKAALDLLEAEGFDRRKIRFIHV